MGANFVLPPPIKGRTGQNCAKDAKVLKNLSPGPKINEGLKKIVLEFLPNAISAFGTMIFSAVEALLTFLGVDPDGVVMKSVRFIKESFLKFPENIANLITGITDFVVEKFDIAKNFITKTIPQFFTDMKNSIIQGIKDMISFIVDPIVELKDNIAEGIDIGVEKIKSSIVGIINKIKDVFAGFVNNLKGMANSVIDLVNKIPGVNFGKFEMTPLSADIIKEETGDATIAGNVAAERRLKVEKKADYMRTSTDVVFGKDDDSLLSKRKSISELGDIMDRYEKRADLLFEMNEADKLAFDAKYEQQGQPIVVANSTTGGDVINQTSVYSAEPASDHQDITAKHLAVGAGGHRG